jgi:hypothetical protein
MSDSSETVIDFGAIDFTPEWARKSAGVTVSSPVAAPPRERAKSPYPKGGDRRDFPRKHEGGKKPFGERKNFDRPRHEPVKVRSLDAEIKILPETKALGTIIRKLQQDSHAYKLKDLAYFFLDNPQSILLKITPRGEEKFCQCKACGFVATSADSLVAHVLSAHFSDYYERREIECEMPKGNFSSVARCLLSGELLGPPNAHDFKSRIAEMLERNPGMSEQEYRSHIEIVRDAETIEEWRKSATKKAVYTAKGGEGELTRDQAEGEFRRNILSSLMHEPKHLMVTADVALKSPVQPLRLAVSRAIEAELKAPYNMCFALRGAFHHRKLNFFRVNNARGSEFVTSVEYREFDSAHAIAELAKIADFIAENPCCDKTELPGDEESLKHLAWLVSTGHVVSFTNGVYSKVEKFPKYGPQWKNRAKSGAAAETAEAPAVEEKESVEQEEEKRDEVAPQLAE